ncbi:MAG: hypothetical protein ABIS06_09905 [Vicinamibacterales bacterium]
MRLLAVVQIALLLVVVSSDKSLDAIDLRAFADRIWFTPGPGTLDMQRLFEAPGEWPRARAAIQVFKFYQQHTEPAASIVGPNTYDALARSGAFVKVTRDWKKRIALEAGSVKDFYCTPDSSGMEASIAATQRSIAAIRSAGGLLTYLAMDEPFLAGQAARCGGPSFAPTASRLRTYMTAIRRTNPEVRIGLIEAYPFFTPTQFGEMLALMKAEGVPAAFVHADVYLPALRKGRDDLGSDLIRLAEIAAAYRIPYGLIIWGENGNADALYSADARRLATAIHRTFRDWRVMPDHLIFQSWAESSTGLRITPSNLPESRPDTHTFLVNDLYQQLRFARVPR